MELIEDMILSLVKENDNLRKYNRWMGAFAAMTAIIFLYNLIF